MAPDFFNKLLVKLKAKKSLWADTVFYFVVALLLSSIISYFLLILKIPFQAKKVEELTVAIVQFGSHRQKDLEREILAHQRRIGIFSVLLKAHKIPSNVFDFFEQNIFSNIRFSSFRLNVGAPKIELTGTSEDVLTLARQLAVFKGSDFIINIDNLSLSREEEGGVVFTTSLSLSPQILIWK